MPPGMCRMPVGGGKENSSSMCLGAAIGASSGERRAPYIAEVGGLRNWYCGRLPLRRPEEDRIPNRSRLLVLCNAEALSLTATWPQSRA